MNYQMWDQHWGWRNEPHNDDVKMILWTVFLVHCNFVKFILFAASCQRSVCNASILNGTSWCKSRWGCCPFKESDAGIPNLVLSPGARASLSVQFDLLPVRVTLYFLSYCPALIFASCLPYLVILAFWEGLTHDYLWIVCLLKIALIYNSKIRVSRCMSKVES